MRAEMADEQSTTKTVFLLRHGESEHNVSGVDEVDSQLTVRGCAQAASWRDEVTQLGVELVLVSPLRRTLRTACLAFEACRGTRLQICRQARELYWHDQQCRGCGDDELAELLCELPRGDEIEGLEELDEPSALWDPAGEARLAADPDGANILAQRARQCAASLPSAVGAHPERCIAVATSWGVISQLTGIGPDNCDIVVCELTRQRRGHGTHVWKLEAKETRSSPHALAEEAAEGQ